jgi:hypothetical protein
MYRCPLEDCFYRSLLGHESGVLRVVCGLRNLCPFHLYLIMPELNTNVLKVKARKSYSEKPV